ncbi:MAG TPA: SDR family oxidoreductase, partial [bacterium]|nr:SDR family oxidoreductase [bacterium]
VYHSQKGDAKATQKLVGEEGRQCLLIRGDVGDSAFCEKAVKQTVKEFGKLDILVNNAAYQASKPSLLDITDEEIERTFRTNIYGYLFMARAALPYLRPGAAIINTGSVTGLKGNKNMIDYASTKGAIHAFTKSLAGSLVEEGIRVNCVAPGPVWTPLNPADKGRSPDEVEEFGKNTPYGRPAQPEEIAPTYVYLASDADSSYITGEVIALLGGETLGAG